MSFLAGLGFSFFNVGCDQKGHSPVESFFAIFGLVSVFINKSLERWCRRKRFKSCVSTHSKQLNRGKELAGYPLRFIF